MQSKFLTFHQAIKLTDGTHNSALREKRDRVLTRLRNSMPVSFTTFNQGSYAMSTGVRPLDGDYDIDVGVVLNVSGVPGVPQAKRWVYEAVSSHTSRVEWKAPCITVYYQQGGEARYHVDLPVYYQNHDGLWLALGKQHAGNPQWRNEDPKGFIALVQNHSAGEDRNQFRRVIRFLKRWRDMHFPSHGAAAPVGIGLTVLALQGFQPHLSTWGATGAANYDDLAALRAFVGWMRGRFGWSARIEARMPVAPRDDVFARMTDQHMSEFKVRLDKLAAWLDEAKQYGSVAPLRRAFGDDFPA